MNSKLYLKASSQNTIPMKTKIIKVPIIKKDSLNTVPNKVEKTEKNVSLKIMTTTKNNEQVKKLYLIKYCF